jgi:hypothetical protein
VDVVAVIDAREDGPRLPGIRHLKGAVVTGTTGRLALAASPPARPGARGEHRLRRPRRLGRLEPHAGADLPPLRPAPLGRSIAGLRPLAQGPEDLLVAGGASGAMSPTPPGHRRRRAAEALADLGLVAPPAQIPQAEDARWTRSPSGHVRARAAPGSISRTTSPSRTSSSPIRRTFAPSSTSSATHPRHGHRPGQDVQRPGPCGHGRAHRRSSPRPAPAVFRPPPRRRHGHPRRRSREGTSSPPA